ncbi:haloacid dehalogenase type II [Salinisphaera sp. PC39]|uniref:haloacid dehalogenase type II n=1 Tax=Salinisphaera sp. PC39 TaxID=1304156 RepID=UPI00333F1213
MAFDVIETLFPLEPLRQRLVAAGLPAYILETWFAQILRDGFALDTAGVFRPFREVAADTLSRFLAEYGLAAGNDEVETVLAGFSRLDAHADVAPALAMLRANGVYAMAVTNGSAAVTHTLLGRAGLEDMLERVVSIDEVGHWKPCREVYARCVDLAGIRPRQLALVAAHGWDVQGAGRAGLMTGYVRRDGLAVPATIERPDAVGADLIDVLDQLFGLTAR